MNRLFFILAFIFSFPSFSYVQVVCGKTSSVKLKAIENLNIELKSKKYKVVNNIGSLSFIDDSHTPIQGYRKNHKEGLLSKVNGKRVNIFSACIALQLE